MSELGQKQAFASQQSMSRLSPKADMRGAAKDIRFGPKRDIHKAEIFGLFQPSFAQAFEKFRHLTRRIRNILLAPCERHIGLQFA